jgi:hypothetical protein
MGTRTVHMIEIHDSRVSGDQAYARALSKFGRRPGRSFVKLVGFVSLVCGVAAAQTAATSASVVHADLKIMIAVFFVVAALGVGLWFVDSARKHPQVYANAFKAIGILLVLGFVAHRIRKGMVNIVADGVAEGEKRAHRDDWTSL